MHKKRIYQYENKNLEIWEDWDGKIIFHENLENIELEINIICNFIGVTMKKSLFYREFSLEDDGLHYSFTIK